ncbi:hypothetical protein ScPMuIL_006791 [Solemya velum]
MASTVRRSTFVLSECKSVDSSCSSGIDRQNVMRLRINRIALVQELRVEHVLQHLIETGVLTKDDRQKIESGTRPVDRTRILIDILPTKNKETEWYKHFRESLQNPKGNSEVKKRYKSLVEFLDNIVIHRPDTQVSRFGNGIDHGSLRLPHYHQIPSIEPTQTTQNILNLEEDRKKIGQYEDHQEKGAGDNGPERETKPPLPHLDNIQPVTLVRGFVQQWIPTPDNYRSLIQIPEDHFRSLQESSQPDDKIQLQQELKVLEKMKRLELVSALWQRKLLPSGFELSVCDISQDILYEPNLYHLYFKYFRMLESAAVNILVDMSNSFISVVSNLDISRFTEDMKQTVNIGFCLVDILMDYGSYAESEAILDFLSQVLNLSDNPGLCMTKYRVFSKLFQLHNSNYNFTAAQNAHSHIQEIGELTSLERTKTDENSLDESELFAELGTLMLELGFMKEANSLTQKALKRADGHNKRGVVNVLCGAVAVYCAHWQGKEAEMLAIQAVQQAKEAFGKRHPLYLKALLSYCHWASEFKPDDHKLSIQIAIFALETAKKIYVCDTIQVALAHRAVSKVYLTNQDFDKGQQSTQYATEALRIAQSCLPENHVMLYLFLHTSACALQWKGLSMSKSELMSTLHRAEDQAKEALDLVSTHYKEVSLATARMYLLIGQIYSKMDRMEGALEMFEKSVSYMKKCQPANSNFLLLAMATLGTFYRIMQKPKEAIAMFKSVVNTVESGGVYLHWVHMCYSNLISTLQALNNNKDADDVQVQYSQWLRNNPKHHKSNTLEELNAQPQPFTEFMEKLNVLEKHKDA